jgi:hypothetical protein
VNNFKDILNEAMKVRIFEEEAFVEPEVVAPTAEPTADVPAVQDAPLPAADQAPVKPEVTDELVASLTETNPAIKDVDQGEFKKGLEVELEHLETVGGDMNITAKIVLDHIKEFPGKNYYAALAVMEEGLREPAVDEVAEPVAEEPIAAPAEEPAVEESKDKKALAQTKNESAPVEKK